MAVRQTKRLALRVNLISCLVFQNQFVIKDGKCMNPLFLILLVNQINTLPSRQMIQHINTTVFI